MQLQQDPNKIAGYGWEFTYVDGQWISKAIPFANKFAVHGERPPYHVGEVLEQKYVRLFEQCLHHAVRDVDKYLVVPAHEIPTV